MPPAATEVAPSTDRRIERPKLLSDAQVRSFVDQGFYVAPNLITRDEIDEMCADIVAISRGRYPCEKLQPVPDTVSDADVLKNVLCVHQPHFISPVISKYIQHPKICGILSQITAAHLPHWDGSVKCMQSMFFVKPPGFQGQAWHQDEIYIPTRDRSLVGAWIALDDATIENGCLWVIPGSNRNGYLYPQHAHENPDEFDFAPESFGFDQSAEVPVEVKAGTLVFFNGHLLHRSRKNRSKTAYRRVLVNHYMNAWSLLPWHMPEKKEGEKPPGIAQVDVRRVVSVAGVDPYAWKGTDMPPREVYLRTCKANTPESRKP